MELKARLNIVQPIMKGRSRFVRVDSTNQLTKPALRQWAGLVSWLVGLEINGPVSTGKVMLSQSVYYFLGRLSPLLVVN